jgi:hypothetical protein
MTVSGLLVLDVIMPKKIGKGTYDNIKGITPDIKALSTSGYPAYHNGQRDAWRQRGIHLKACLPKELLRRAGEVLDR